MSESEFANRDNEEVFCIVKFGKLKHLKSFINKGELCFNSTLRYNNIEETNPEKGDGYEGAEFLKSTGSMSKKRMPKKGYPNNRFISSASSL